MPAPRGLRLWSPESPTLYDVRFAAGEDVLPDRIGLRTIEVRGEDILLNGRPIFLRGVSHARGGTGRESEPDDHAGRRPRLAHRGARRPPRQFRPPRPLSAQRGDDADGGRARPARLERDPGLLAGRFRPARDARRRPGACSPRISCATATAPRSSCGASATRLRRARRGSPSCAPWSDDVRALDDSRLVTAALLSRREGNRPDDRRSADRRPRCDGGQHL